MTDTKQSTPTPQADPKPVLRCNRCDKPITPETAVLTPTGYRCKECVRSQQKVFDTSKATDLPLAFFIAFLFSFAASWLAARLSFLVLLVAPGLGLLIANTVRWATNKRRSKKLNKAVLWGAVLGSLPVLVLRLVPLLFGGAEPIFVLSGLLPVVWQLAFAGMVSSSAYYQLAGIRLR